MMKSALFLGSMMFLSSFSVLSFQDELALKDVPEAVKSALAAKFPGAEKVEWEKEGEHFEAEFLLNSQEHEVILDASGAVLKFKHSITETDIPAAVANAIQQEHSGMRITEAEKLQEGDQVFYQLELEKEEQEIELVFSEAGQKQQETAKWD